MRSFVRSISTFVTGLGLCAVAACSGGAGPVPVPVPTGAPASSSTPAPAAPTTKPAVTAAPPAGGGSACRVAAGTQPVPTVEEYGTAPEAAQLSITLNGLPAGTTVVAGAAPVTFTATVCNSSPVAYPQVNLIPVLTSCTCALNENIQLPEGTMERLDATTGKWVPVVPAVGSLGADDLLTGIDLGAFPKGRSVTVTLRTALDAKMKDGNGGVRVSAAVHSGRYAIGRVESKFTVKAR